MGCHPSHWRTHIFQDGWNHQPVIEPRKMEDFSCNLAILNMPYIYMVGTSNQSVPVAWPLMENLWCQLWRMIGKWYWFVGFQWFFFVARAVTACCKCGGVAPWSWPNMCKSCIEPLKILELEFTIFMFWLLSVVPFDTCFFSCFHVDILWDCKNYIELSSFTTI